MKHKFNIGDTVIRKDLPQYKGLGRPILTITDIDDEYYYCGVDEGGCKMVFNRSGENDFELYYKGGLWNRISKWLKGVKKDSV